MWRTADLAGCAVFTEDGRLLGTLTDVLPSGSNDIWVVAAEGQPEVLLPALRTVVRSVDTAARRIVVSPPPGLLDIYRPPVA